MDDEPGDDHAVGIDTQKPTVEDILSNTDLIEETQLSAICQDVPAGARLYVRLDADAIASLLDTFSLKTQIFKGLFKLYREYTWRCLDEFVDDNIQYGMYRIFMAPNRAWKDDDSIRADNIGIMDLTNNEYEAFQKDHPRFTGQASPSCRRGYQNHLTDFSEWDEESMDKVEPLFKR